MYKQNLALNNLQGVWSTPSLALLWSTLTQNGRTCSDSIYKLGKKTAQSFTKDYYR